MIVTMPPPTVTSGSGFPRSCPSELRVTLLRGGVAPTAARRSGDPRAGCGVQMPHGIPLPQPVAQARRAGSANVGGTHTCGPARAGEAGPVSRSPPAPRRPRSCSALITPGSIRSHRKYAIIRGPAAPERGPARSVPRWA